MDLARTDPAEPGAQADSSGSDDLSPLAWVQQELRRSFELAHKALRRGVREGAVDAATEAADQAQARQALLHLHQAAGALELVGVRPPARVVAACEQAVLRLTTPPHKLSAAAVDSLEFACFAVLDYNQRQLADKPAQPLELFPQYRAAMELAGAERIHPADLWPLEWRWRELPADASAQPRPVDAATRAEVERATLDSLRQPLGTPARQLSALYAGLGAGSGRKPHLATLWKLAGAFFEAQSRGLLLADVYGKRMASRLLALLRAEERGSGADDADLTQAAKELLFFCAQAVEPAPGDAAAPRVAAVREAWTLGRARSGAPLDYQTSRLGRFDPAWVQTAQKRVGAAKEAWSAVAGGELHWLPGLTDQFGAVGDSTRRLIPCGEPLARALTDAVAQTVQAGQAPPAELAMEVATSVLYLEATLEDADFDAPGQDERIQQLAQRIDAVRGGRSPEPLPGWIEDLYRRVSDRQTIGSVVQELRAALAESEKTIDQYFRDPSQRALLIPVPAQLQSMRGVLSVLGLDHASLAVLRMRDDVDQLAITELDAAQAARHPTVERLTSNLGALGFLIDLLSVQPRMAKSLFVFDSAGGLLRSVLGGGKLHPPPVPTEAVSASAPAAAAVAADAVVPTAAEIVAPTTAETVAPAALLETPAALSFGEATQPLPPFAEVTQPLPNVHLGGVDSASVELGNVDLGSVDLGSVDLENLPLGLGADADAAAPLAALVAGDASPEFDAAADNAADSAVDTAAADNAADTAADHAIDAAADAVAAAADFDLELPGAAPAVPVADAAPAAAVAAAAMPAAAAPVGVAMVPAVDDELLSVFLEEAAEVMQMAHGSVDALRHTPDDLAELTSLRRVFHTLKGSARMVGLDAFGEAAWAGEQLFNARLAQEPRADAALLGFCDGALGYLGDWIRHIEARRDGGHEAEPVRAAADALRLQRRELRIALPGAAADGDSADLASADAADLDDDFKLTLDDAGTAEADASADGATDASTDAATDAELPNIDEFADLIGVVDAAAHDAPTLAQRVPGLPSAADLDLQAAASDFDFELPAGDAATQDGELLAADFDLDGLAPKAAPATAAVNAEAEAEAEAETQATGPSASPSAFGALDSSLGLLDGGAAGLDLDLDADADVHLSAPQLLLEPTPGDDDVDLELVLGDPLISSAPLPFDALSPIASGSAPSLHGFDLGGVGAADAPAVVAGAALVAEPAPAASLPEAAAADEETIKRIGPLTVSLPLFNIYLQEAEELSRRLGARLAAWAALPTQPVPEDAAAHAHGLAGSSATVGFADLSELARALEHALLHQHAAGPDHAGDAQADAQLYLEAADEIRALLHQFAAGLLKQPKPGLVDRLHAQQQRLAERAHEAGLAEVEEADFEAAGSGTVPGEFDALADVDALPALADDDADARIEAEAGTGAEAEAEAEAEIDADEFAQLHEQAAAEALDDEAALPFVQSVAMPLTAFAALGVDDGDDDGIAPPLHATSPALAAAALQRAIDDIDDDDIEAIDSPDAELFPIFEEEAQDLLPQLASRLREWARAPQDAAGPSACMRTLHTLKGSARLAGAMRLGELAHRLETVIGHLLARGDVQADDVEALQSRADGIEAAFQSLRAGARAEAPAEAGLDDDSDSAPAAPATAASADATPAPAQPLPAPPASAASASAAPASASPSSAAPAAAADALPTSAAATWPTIGAVQPPAATPPLPLAVEADDAADLASPLAAAAPLLSPFAAGSAPAQPDAAAWPQPAQLPPSLDWSAFTHEERRAAPRPTAVGSAMQAAVRVRAPVLDRMVNDAGEASIARARIEADLGQMKSSLADLTDNLDRLRSQLRDIELQAEVQIGSRLEAVRGTQAFDPLELDRYTRFQELTRMMAESVNDVATVHRTMQRALQSTEDQLATQSRLMRDLQDHLLRTRMVEFESLSDRLYRTVRQAGKDTGKQVRLDIVGGAIEVDRGVLDRMTGAFEHLLRNAVSHGIEPADRRAAAGKDAAGQVTITVTQEGNEVGIEFRDDGAGLELAAIRERGQALGLLAPGAPASDADIANLIFAPGVTTAKHVSEVAGRGVGMDVVRSEVVAMGGRIETATSAGRGTSFRLVLPLTTAVTQVVMLRAGAVTVAVPSMLIESLPRASAAQLHSAYERGAIEAGGQQLPFFWLGALLEASPRGNLPEHGDAPLALVRSAQQRIALHVDEVLGSQDVVVRHLGPQLARLPGLAGATLLASGVPALIYNPVALATLYGDSARAAMRGGADGEGDGGAERAAAAPLVLVVDDSITVRRVTQRLLQREGYRVALAKDGVEALARLREERPVVMLSDIEMPQMDGFDLVRALRADAALADLPVVMITSRIAPKHRELALQLGVAHYLGKPYAEDELLALVAGCAQAATASAG